MDNYNNNNIPQNGNVPFEPSKPFTDNTNPQNPILQNQAQPENTQQTATPLAQNQYDNMADEVNEYITSESPRIEPAPEELPQVEADEDYIFPNSKPQPEFPQDNAYQPQPEYPQNNAQPIQPTQPTQPYGDINYAFPQATAQPQQNTQPYGYQQKKPVQSPQGYQPPNGNRQANTQPYANPVQQYDYSNPVYRGNNNAQQNNPKYTAYNPNISPAQQGMPPQGYPYPYGGQVSNPPFTAPAPQKKGISTGLAVVITVIVMLLIGSIAGMIIFTASNKSDNNNQNNINNGDSYGITIPDETKPEEEESTTAPSNDKSDYSEQIDSKFKGIELLSKPKDANKNSKYTSEYAFNRISESVVGIVCYVGEITNVENCDSQGSGIIVTADGYVITNSHVIANSKTAYKIQVIMADGTTYNAGVVGFDSRTDIAVLKIDNAKNLKPATFGNSEEIELGEDIIVVGNPGGIDYQNSITKGVVSAVNRKLSSSSLVKYIQTDAAINPGNSGGPIVNMYGQVIGIATSKIVSEYYENMGFAIPSATAKDIVDSLIKNGYVSGRVKIGISGYEMSAEEAQMYGFPQGIIVDEIVAGGPCDGSGLQKDDIITEADGKEIHSFADMYEMLEGHKAGDKIKIKYFRQSDSSTGEVEVVLQEDK